MTSFNGRLTYAVSSFNFVGVKKTTLVIIISDVLVFKDVYESSSLPC